MDQLMLVKQRNKERGVLSALRVAPRGVTIHSQDVGHATRTYTCDAPHGIPNRYVRVVPGHNETGQ